MLIPVFLTLSLLVSKALAITAPYTVTGEKVELEHSTIYVVGIEGALASGVADAAIAELDKAQGDAIYLELNSRGGYFTEADKLIQHIDKMRASGKTVNTFVPNGSVCASSCTFVFLAGEKRSAGEAAAFMVHGVQRESMPGFLDHVMTARVLEIYKDRGVNQEWIMNLRKQGVFTRINDFWFSGKDGASKDIGFVTDLLSGVVEHTPPPIDPQIRPRIIAPSVFP